MAISWITALKVIPWGDVIEAAPAIAKGARRFFARTREEAEPAPPPLSAPQDTALAEAQERIRHLEAAVAKLVEGQQASAALIESLAEHNAKVVEAVEILRARTRLLLVAGGVLVLALVGLAWWLAR